VLSKDGPQLVAAGGGQGQGRLVVGVRQGYAWLQQLSHLLTQLPRVLAQLVGTTAGTFEDLNGHLSLGKLVERSG
jgi:hypothetical protein